MADKFVFVQVIYTEHEFLPPFMVKLKKRAKMEDEEIEACIEKELKSKLTAAGMGTLVSDDVCSK